MSAGPLVGGAGLLAFARLDERADYVADVLPAALLFGLGLATTVAPLTATVLEAADRRYAPIASGVNNAIARVAALLAVAAVGAVVAAPRSIAGSRTFLPTRRRASTSTSRASMRWRCPRAAGPRWCARGCATRMSRRSAPG